MQVEKNKIILKEDYHFYIWLLSTNMFMFWNRDIFKQIFKKNSKLFISYFKNKNNNDVIHVEFGQLYVWLVVIFKKQQQQNMNCFTYFIKKKINHAYKHVHLLKHVSAI